jgi:hypothetical protein
MKIPVDPTKGVSKLLTPGSKFYLLRPRGFGKTSLVDYLKTFLQGGEERKELIHRNTWLFQNRKALVNNFPSLPTIKLDFNNIVLGEYELYDPETYLKDQILRVQETHQTKKKIALLIDNYDAPFLNGNLSTSKFVGDVLKLSCDYHDNIEFLSYIFVTGVYRVGEKNSYQSLLRMKDLSLDLYHHDTIGVSDSEIRKYFALSNNWLSDGGKRFGNRDLQQGDNQEPEKHVNSNGCNVVPKRTRSFRWNDEIGDREEVMLFNNGDTETIEQISDASNAVVDDITKNGGYWWGGYDDEGRHELVHPYDIDSSNSSSLMLDFEKVGVPSNVQFKSIVNAILYDIPFDLFLHGKLNFEKYDSNENGETNMWQMSNSVHLPSLLLQHGLLTLESRAAVVREFHSEVFVRLCFPNKLRQEELLTIVLSKWMFFPLETLELIKSTLHAIKSTCMLGGDRKSVLKHIDSLKTIMLKESHSNELIMDEQVQSYLFLFLLTCVPDIQVSRSDPIYVEGGPSDTFVHEQAGMHLESEHNTQAFIENNLLEKPIVLSVATSSINNTIVIHSLDGENNIDFL